MKKEVYEQVGVAMTCRSFKEYEKMFVLDDELLGKGPILDVAAGASSFTAEANKLGYQAVAVDPLYSMTADQIRQHGETEIETSTAKLAEVAHTYLWDDYGSLKQHQANREQLLELFASDYEIDKGKTRYVTETLPALPFADGTFSLVLCSHFLFLYQEQFDYSFHLQAIEELVRVCHDGGEVRMYPLVGFKKELYPHFDELSGVLREKGLTVDLLPTDFRFLPGATHVLRVKK